MFDVFLQKCDYSESAVYCVFILHKTPSGCVKDEYASSYRLGYSEW